MAVVTIRKLSAEEAQRAFPRRGQQDLSEYVDALRGLGPGEAASIDRQGLTDRAVKRRVGQAANTLGYRLKWSRQSGENVLYFQVVSGQAARAANGRRRRRSAPAETPVAAPAAAAPARPAEPHLLPV